MIVSLFQDSFRRAREYRAAGVGLTRILLDLSLTSFTKRYPGSFLQVVNRTSANEQLTLGRTWPPGEQFWQDERCLAIWDEEE
jgi:hypothetical protein